MKNDTQNAKPLVRWEAKGVDHQTTRYALRTAPKGQGIEIGAYTSWDTPKATSASEPIADAIEETARAAGYEIGEESWNDLADSD